jgi:PAS domain S-box-containing protein
MKNSLFAEHITISIVILAVLSGLAFFSFPVLDDILVGDMQFLIFRIPIIFVCVLVSYIVYLLLSLQTRAELVAFHIAKPLTSSLEQFEKLFEEAPVPYLILSRKGEILRTNKSALRFFGVVFGDIENKNLFSFEPLEDKEKAERLDRYYKSHIPINKEEVRMVTKNGAVKWAILSVFEIKSFGDFKDVGLATVFDITEQKQLDRAKTEFVSLASHQLRTPVSTIKWYTEMLLSGSLGEFTPKQKEYIEIINKVDENMIDLIDALLNVSRIEIGTLKVDLKTTNVIEITESVLVELSSQIKEKGLKIDKQYGDNLKDMETDPKLIRMVIQNLISNAVKYTPVEGTVTINFKDSFGEKIITISDTGVGIPEVEQDKIFTKLFRATNVRSLLGSQGTGLGLYLVKSIVKTMGGSISFASEENKGAAFTVKF